MYRNEWDAAVARAEALSTQLRQAQAGQQQDAATIAALTQQLHQAHAELQRLRGPYAAPPMYGGMPVYMQASQGTTILVYGILSLVVCSILGPIAWSMGNAELARIDAGLVDPSGRGNASAGRICGMIATILMIVSFVIVIMIFAAAGTASNF